MENIITELATDKRIHLIGVAGSGMSGLASLFLQLGFKVSGSDKVTTGETERLQKAGLQFSCPHSAESVQGADVVVYSSAVKAGNKAYDAAVALGIPLMRRAEALASVMQHKKGVVIAGTHGKTTTSAMSAYVLRAGELKPSHYVGAEIPILGTNAHWEDQGEHFVAEGDESDGTLVNFRPQHSIILNIEAEHLDHYTGGLEQIYGVFRQLINQTPGNIFYCCDDEGADELCGTLERGISYGFKKEADFQAINMSQMGQSSAFDVRHEGAVLGSLVLNIPGRHNVLNALSVVALATTLGVPFTKISWALGMFRGARRRFEVKHHTFNYMVVDDYGHHPTEIDAVISTARAMRPKRVVCLFQPHRYTRTKLLLNEFGEALGKADAVFISRIYEASEKPIPGVTGESIVEEIKAQHGDKFPVFYTPDLATAHFDAGNYLRAGDVFMSLGAGDVHKAATKIAADLRVLEEIRSALDEDADAVLKLYEPMSRHTTIRIGGPAQFWIEPTTIEGFAALVRHLRLNGIPIRVVGRGSNLLILDGGISGAVIHPSKGEFDEVEVEGDLIKAGVGARFKKVTSAARTAGLGGFEWMEGIPGNVGGCIRMNAGAMGVETFDQVVSVRYIDQMGELEEKSVDEIHHEYRNVPEFSEHFAVSAVFKGTPAPLDEIDSRIEQSKAKRKLTQPIAASAGCIFKNPMPDLPAGKLVEELGLKTHGVGNASVSDVHGNFIVNEGNATADDVMRLIDEIKEKARSERGITLETEVQILGQELQST